MGASRLSFAMTSSRHGRTWRFRNRKRRSQVPIQLLEEERDTFIDLVRWMTSKGFCGKSCFLQLRSFTDTGRGLMANRTLCSGSDVINVPEALIITTQTVLASYLGPILQTCSKERLSPVQALCLFLMCEYHKGSASLWWPYLQTLPRSYTTPVHWDAHILDISPKCLQKKAVNQRTEVSSLFRKCSDVITCLENAEPALRGGLTLEAFQWAWSTINTRCVYWKQPAGNKAILSGDVDHYALVPLLDMLNHTASAQVEAGFDSISRTFRIRTLTTYKRRQQVFINYGPHDNTKLLIEYGFVLPQNPNNIITWNIDELVDEVQVILDLNAEDLDTKLKLISQNSLTEGLLCSMDGLSWSLLTVLKVLALDVELLSEIEKCLEDDYLSDSHEENTCRLVFHLMENKKEEFMFDKKAYKGDSTDLLEMMAALCLQYLDILCHCQKSLDS